MITVIGWCAGGKEGEGVGVFSQWGRWGKTSVQTSSNRFLKTLTEGAVTMEAGELIPIFRNPHRKCRPSPSAVAGTLEYLEDVPSKATSSGRKEKQVRINIQKALEYLEGGNQVIPKSSPLQEMKAQSLQSLFICQLPTL